MSTVTTPPSPAFTRSGPSWRYRVESMPVRRLQDFTLAAAVVTVGAVAHAANLSAAPGRSGAEGVLVGRAWLLDDGGLVSRATDWYDHPPLGWLLLGAWTSLTSAFDRAPTAVAAGRELMLVAYVASAALLWVLGRRLRLRRWSAALALATFGLLPPVVELHRRVSLDNLAVPWALAAFALASHPRRPLFAYAGSGACLGAAVLTREWALLLAPLLAWHLRRSSVPSTRRYALTVSSTVFALVLLGSGLGVAAAGELAASSNHPGLLDGLGHRLTHLDGVVGGGGVAIAVLPAAALAVAALAQTAWHRREATGRPGTPLLFVGAVAAVAVAAWWGTERGLVTGDDPTAADEALAGAEVWVRTELSQLPVPVRLVTDDALWADLVVAGVPADRVTATGALELPADVGPVAPAWEDHQVVVATAAVRDAAPAGLLDDAVPLALFGSGAERIEVLRVGPRPDLPHDVDAAAAQGTALTRNPALVLAMGPAEDLAAGRVDTRLTTTLVALAAAGPVELRELPAPPAEQAAGMPRRVAVLGFGSPEEARSAAGLLRAQQPPYLPARVDLDAAAGQVTVTYLPAPLA